MVKEILLGIYVRCSTHKQDLIIQENKIGDFLQYYKTKNNVKNFKWYKDNAVSGKNEKRVQFSLLKNDIEKGNVNTVLALKLDRLGRSLRDLLNFSEFLERQKCNLILVNENIDTSTTHGKLLFQIMGAFAEFERETIIERMAAGRKRAELLGKTCHRPKKKLDFYQIKNLYEKGLSLNAISKIMNCHYLTIKSRLVEGGVYNNGNIQKTN